LVNLDPMNKKVVRVCVRYMLDMRLQASSSIQDADATIHERYGITIQ
jgi:hypothetical protein